MLFVFSLLVKKCIFLTTKILKLIHCCCVGLDPELLFLRTLLHIEVIDVFLLHLFFQWSMQYLYNECLCCNEFFYIIMHSGKSTGAFHKFWYLKKNFFKTFWNSTEVCKTKNYKLFSTIRQNWNSFLKKRYSE